MDHSDHTLLVQRFKFLNAVHAIAAADVAQCIEAVGLDALKGVAASQALANVRRSFSDRRKQRVDRTVESTPLTNERRVARENVGKPTPRGAAEVERPALRTLSQEEEKPKAPRPEKTAAEQAAVLQLAMILERTRIEHEQRRGATKEPEKPRPAPVNTGTMTQSLVERESSRKHHHAKVLEAVSIQTEASAAARGLVDHGVNTLLATETRATSPDVVPPKKFVSFGIETDAPPHVNRTTSIGELFDEPKISCATETVDLPPTGRVDNRSVDPPAAKPLSDVRELPRESHVNVTRQSSRQLQLSAVTSGPSLAELLTSVDELLRVESTIAQRSVDAPPTPTAQRATEPLESPPTRRKRKTQRGRISTEMSASILRSANALREANKFNESLWNVSGVPMSQFGRRFAESLLHDLVIEVQNEICSVIDDAVDDVVEYEVGADQ